MCSSSSIQVELPCDGYRLSLTFRYFPHLFMRLLRAFSVKITSLDRTHRINGENKPQWYVDEKSSHQGKNSTFLQVNTESI